MLLRRCYSVAIPFSNPSTPVPRRARPCTRRCISVLPAYFSLFALSAPPHSTIQALSFSSENSLASSENELTEQVPSKQGPLKPGLYLVGTPIGNLEDITLRALRVLKSADVILSEDTRHSVVLKRLQEGEIVALISDAGTPGISDPGMELAKLCVDKDIPVIPVPGPSAVVAALSASGLPTNEFTFVGFLPKHAGTRRERLMVSANSAATQVFFVPPHKLCQFLDETSLIFGQSRRCVIAREMTKLHEEFWRGNIEEAKEVFSAHQPKGEITLMIEGMTISEGETLTESQLESELGELISKGHSLSVAVKLVATGTSMKRKAIYSLALQKFGKQLGSESSDDKD